MHGRSSALGARRQNFNLQLRVGLHLGFLACIAAVLVAWSSVGVSRTQPSQDREAVVRADRPIYVHDAGLVLELPTRAETVQEALHQAGVLLKPGDLTTPEAGRPVTAGAHVYIDRAKDVTLLADGQERELRTRAATVAELLQGTDIALGPLDRVAPDLDAPVGTGLRVQLIRVRDERYVEQEALSFLTRYQPDADLEIGHQRETEPGEIGIFKRQVLIRYEDNTEVHRIVEREYLERPPRPRLMTYGTKVIPYYVDTETGAFQYYRKMRVWATWYSPRSAGKPAWSPGYGITSVGLRARRGIIAVDPRVIPYWTQIYVPGYGVGIAADTGGGIIGNWIDLAFADDEPPDWRTGWVDIYLLGPPPPPQPPR